MDYHKKLYKFAFKLITQVLERGGKTREVLSEASKDPNWFALWWLT